MLVTELSYLFKKKAAWLGQKPPIKADAFLLCPQRNFRASPDKHGIYEVVWAYEDNLFSTPNWPLLLDEMLRLLQKQGELVVRINDNLDGTIIELKSYLFRRYDISTQLSKQLKTDTGSTVCIFSVSRKYFEKIKNTDWTIGILTNGTKNNNVVHLINKIALLAHGVKLEFLVIGPFDAAQTNVSSKVKVMNLTYHDSLPRIGEKKHLIAKCANHENVAIFHDRYQINTDFFTGFEVFGYDFDFITIKQSYINGSLFPGYAGLDQPLLKWSVPRYDRNPGTLHIGHFINGGLMIFKKSLLEVINFNPLLLHNEAEDVEMSFTLRQSGIIPRLNIFSSAITIGIPDTYTGMFVDISDTMREKSPTIKNHMHPLYRIWKLLPERIKMILRYSRICNWVRRRIVY